MQTSSPLKSEWKQQPNPAGYHYNPALHLQKQSGHADRNHGTLQVTVAGDMYCQKTDDHAPHQTMFGKLNLCETLPNKIDTLCLRY